MAELWYYTSEGRRMEPVSQTEIQQLARSGLLKPTDMVWREGMARWVRASAAREIFPDPRDAVDRALADQPPSAPTPTRLRSESLLSPPQEEPILLEPMQSPLQKGQSSQETDSRRKKRQQDEDDDRDRDRNRPRRRGRRDKTTGLIVLIGLLFGGALLLVVLFLGMLFIALGAR